MSNNELLDKIKVEIERRYKEFDGKTGDIATASRLAYLDVISFLSTLESEKPINPNDAMKELDEKIALVKQRGTWKGVDVDKYMDEVRGREPEKPMELEEEINRYLEPIHTADIQFEPFTQMTKCARHFAEWGYLRAAEKNNEIEYNRQRAEESGSSEIPNDLEEAAMNYIAPIENEDGLKVINFSGQDIKDAFIAGAKWKAEKDARDMYMSDNRHFEKVYQLGRTDMREQMMKEAVEGEITKDNRGNNVVRASVFNKDFEYGDKVRVIVLPKND